MPASPQWLSNNILFKRLIMVLFFVFGLVSCSTTTVHLNTRYLSEEEAKLVTEQLVLSGAKVEINKHEYPRSIEQSALLYSPLISDKKAVNNVLSSLDGVGWSVQTVQPLMADNHWFKKDSIGLYLLPDGVLPNSRRAKADLVQKYTSLDCDDQIVLELEDGGEYQFKFSRSDESRDEFARGKWRITQYPYLELMTEDRMWWFYFEIKEQIEVDKISEIQVTRLRPMNKYTHLDACSFEFGQRF